MQTVREEFVVMFIVLSSSSMARKTPSKKPPAVKPKPKFLTGDYYSNKENRGANGKEKDPVEVFCRLRPLKNPSDAICIKRVNDTTLQLVPFGNNKLELFYTFKYVFDDGTTQKELFDKVAQPLIKDLINGKNGKPFCMTVIIGFLTK